MIASPRSRVFVLMPRIAIFGTLIDKKGIECRPAFPYPAFIKRHHFLQYPSQKLFFILPHILQVHGKRVSILKLIGNFISQPQLIGRVVFIHDLDFILSC